MDRRQGHQFVAIDDLAVPVDRQDAVTVPVEGERDLLGFDAERATGEAPSAKLGRKTLGKP